MKQTGWTTRQFWIDVHGNCYARRYTRPWQLPWQVCLIRPLFQKVKKIVLQKSQKPVPAQINKKNLTLLRFGLKRDRSKVRIQGHLQQSLLVSLYVGDLLSVWGQLFFFQFSFLCLIWHVIKRYWWEISTVQRWASNSQYWWSYGTLNF